MTKIAVISMGQLMSTTLDASVRAFAEASEHSEVYVKAQAVFDELPFGHSYIQEYKKGEIGEAEFFDGLRQRLSRTAEELPDDNIREAWNAMTGITPEHEDKARAVARAIVENDVHLVIASATNPLHQQANLEALQRVLGEHYEPFMEKVTFALSYEEHTLDRSTLAARGIQKATEEHWIEASGTEIASFHSDIQAETVKAQLVGDVQEGHASRIMGRRVSVEQIATAGADFVEQLERFSSHASGLHR